MFFKFGNDPVQVQSLSGRVVVDDVMIDSVPPLGVEQTLNLAQSMIQKQLDTNSLHSFEALMLYIDLLYAQAMQLAMTWIGLRFLCRVKEIEFWSC